MDDDQKYKSQRQIEMDVSPLVAVKIEKILGTLQGRRSLRDEKGKEDSDKSHPNNTYKKKRIHQILPIGFFHAFLLSL
jgi:hypothetical protein